MRIRNALLAGLGLISALGIANASFAQKQSDSTPTSFAAAETTPVSALMAPADAPNDTVRNSGGIVPPGTIDDTQAVSDRLATDRPRRLQEAPAAP